MQFAYESVESSRLWLRFDFTNGRKRTELAAVGVTVLAAAMPVGVGLLFVWSGEVPKQRMDIGRNITDGWKVGSRKTYTTCQFYHNRKPIPQHFSSAPTLSFG